MILIIEDDPAIAEVLTLLLQDEGYPTRTVPSVQEALRTLTVEEHPGLILLDLWLPDPLHLSGFDFLEELDGRYPVRPCPVVVISAAMERDVARKLSAHRVADYVGKPFEAEHLLQVVSRWYPASLYALIGV